MLHCTSGQPANPVTESWTESWFLGRTESNALDTIADSHMRMTAIYHSTSTCAHTIAAKVDKKIR